MVRIIPYSTFEDHQKKISDIISEQIRNHNVITLLDCANSIHHYLFSREDLVHIFKRLFVARIERFYDLMDQLERLPLLPLFITTDLLLLSSITSLLDELPKNNRLLMITRMIRMLERIEQHHHVQSIVLKSSSWDIPYHQNATLSTQNLHNSKSLLTA